MTRPGGNASAAPLSLVARFPAPLRALPNSADQE
jgi:hypothetical protein